MDPVVSSALRLVASTRAAAMLTDGGGTVWFVSPPLREMLGARAGTAIGRRCHEVLCGRDVYGNRFCRPGCIVKQRQTADEAIRPFELVIEVDASPPVRRVLVTTSVFAFEEGSGAALLHQFFVPRPCNEPVAPATTSDTGVRAAEQQAALTLRELEVLSEMAKGRGTREIAGELGLSPITVRNHTQRIFRKLGVHSRVDAVLWAVRNGLS